jgi:hypothetical protein
MPIRLFAVFIWLFADACAQTSDKTGVGKTTPVVTDTTWPAEKKAVHAESCNYDNEVSTLGAGLVIAPTQFEIFTDSLLRDKWIGVDMYAYDGSTSRMCPKFCKPDYGIMHFICVGATNKSYKILVSHSDVAYMPRTRNYTFARWEDYILASYGIRRNGNKGDETTDLLPLRTVPSDSGVVLNIPEDYEMFCPIAVRGDWVKVKYDCFYNQENSPYEGQPCHEYINQCNNPLTGWLRWRQGNKLTIDIFLMP